MNTIGCGMRTGKKLVAGELDFKNPDILAYLNAENAYKEAHMESTRGVQEVLYQEILSRIKEDYQSWPVKKGDYFYYYREEKGKNYPIYCRREGSMEAPESVYMDVNKEAQGKELYLFGPSVPNRANTFLAYGYNLTGSLDRTVRVRNLETGEDSRWSFPNSTGSLLWLDDEHLLVVERDEHARGKNVYKINIKQGPEKKQLVFSKPEAFDNMFLGLSQTNDRQYLMLELSSGSSQVLYVSLRSAVDFKQFAEGKDDVLYKLEHFKNDFYILTNKGGANNFQLFKTPVNRWEQDAWQLVQQESKTISLSSVTFYNRFMVTEQRNNERALDEIVVRDMESNKPTPFPCPMRPTTLLLVATGITTPLRFVLITPRPSGRHRCLSWICQRRKPTPCIPGKLQILMASSTRSNESLLPPGTVPGFRSPLCTKKG